MCMTKDQREIQRKLRILKYADEIGHVAKAYRYFGTGRSSFYRWRQAYGGRGEAGLINAPPIPKWHANRTPPEREEKMLYLRRKYHLGPMRIVWCLERDHDIKMSDATVSRILRRHGMNRLPRGTRMRKVHTKRYQKQVPGHHIQMDVKFLTFKGEKMRRFQYAAIDASQTCKHVLPANGCDAGSGSKDLRKTHSGQCHRFRKSHHRKVPIPHPRNTPPLSGSCCA